MSSIRPGIRLPTTPCPLEKRLEPDSFRSKTGLHNKNKTTNLIYAGHFITSPFCLALVLTQRLCQCRHCLARRRHYLVRKQLIGTCPSQVQGEYRYAGKGGVADQAVS